MYNRTVIFMFAIKIAANGVGTKIAPVIRSHKVVSDLRARLWWLLARMKRAPKSHVIESPISLINHFLLEWWNEKKTKI